MTIIGLHLEFFYLNKLVETKQFATLISCSTLCIVNKIMK